jgi:predicted O-methyltransferase YrrM
MVFYNLSHLTQKEDQNVSGPIQDDEALFLYSIIKGMRLNRILEIGGLSGYSAKNFLAAMDKVDGVLYTVDINPVPKLQNNHIVITKNAFNLTSDDVHSKPIDLIFFDCHDMVQMDIYHKFVKEGIINDSTILSLHDTNLHYAPYQHCGKFVEKENGYAHQPVERKMTNLFKELGYDIFNLHTTQDKHNKDFPVRHGLTVCRKFVSLKE